MNRPFACRPNGIGWLRSSHDEYICSFTFALGIQRATAGDWYTGGTLDADAYEILPRKRVLPNGSCRILFGLAPFQRSAATGSEEDHIGMSLSVFRTRTEDTMEECCCCCSVYTFRQGILILFGVCFLNTECSAWKVKQKCFFLLHRKGLFYKMKYL